MISRPLQKLPNNVGDLGKIIVAIGFEWLPKVQKNPPIWSHCIIRYIIVFRYIKNFPPLLKYLHITEETCCHTDDFITQMAVLLRAHSKDNDSTKSVFLHNTNKLIINLDYFRHFSSTQNASFPFRTSRRQRTRRPKTLSRRRHSTFFRKTRFSTSLTSASSSHIWRRTIDMDKSCCTEVNQKQNWTEFRARWAHKPI